MSASGTRIGPYLLVRPLGEGAAGEVWEAVLEGPAGFRKPVALKRLHATPTEPAQREAFLREARVGALLQHPNVVGTLQLGEHDGTWCVALELVQGPSVDRLCLQVGGPLPPAAVLEIGVQAAAGLLHVHAFRIDGRPAGLVHRDVKPANLVVDRSGVVKVADLGISLLAGEPHEVAGTAAYMAPEQALGRAEPRSDLFALGATLYTIATGRRPFGTGDGALAATRQVEALLQREAFLAPLDLVVPGLGAVVRTCLRHDPADRYATARDLGDALAALRPRLPPGPTLLELLARTWPELGVDVAATPVSDAPTRVLPAGNVPPPRDAFVGREVELAEVAALAESHRWVVLVGPGGRGKTRLSLQAARRLRIALPGGAWAFDLAAAVTADDVCATVAAAIDLDLDRTDAAGHLGRRFRAMGRALVVLDNLEQCVDALPTTVGRWLDVAPECTFLGTTRVVPGLAGERSVALGALPTADAVALFLARAPRALAAAERDEVEPLCRALEGMPLAIELAAARLRGLDAAQVRARLSLALLSGGGRDRPERHRSVTASLRWSWELLGPVARTALAQLSVFAGPFEPRAAEAVLDLAGLPGAPWALDVLRELVEASLLELDAASGRFRLPVVVREFADGLLGPAARAVAEARHAAHFAQHGAPEAVQVLAGAPHAIRALTLDLDDVLAACRWATAAGACDLAVPLLRAADVALRLRGPAGAWVDLAQDLLRVGTLSPPDRAAALRSLGRALMDVGRMADALLAWEGALALHRETGDRRAQGLALAGIGSVRLATGRPGDAEAFFVDAVALFREAGDLRSEGIVTGDLALASLDRGRYEEALGRLERALALHRQVGNRRSEAIMLGNLGGVFDRLGRFAEGEVLHQRALALHRELGNRRSEGKVLGFLGLSRRRQGLGEEARALCEAALAIHREVGNARAEGVTLGHLADLALEEGRLDVALATSERALVLHREVGNRRFEAIELGSQGRIHLALGDRGRSRALHEEALAIHRAVGNRRSEGIALRCLAELDADEGRTEASVAGYESAVALFEEVGDVAQACTALAELSRSRPVDVAAALLARAESRLDVGPNAGVNALVLAARADLLRRSGDLPGAVRTLGEAERAAGDHPDVGRAIGRTRAALPAVSSR